MPLPQLKNAIAERDASSPTSVAKPQARAIAIGVAGEHHSGSLFASPARALQDSLRQSLQSQPEAYDGLYDEVEVKKIPFGYTAAGLIVFCATFWTLLLSLVAH